MRSTLSSMRSMCQQSKQLNHFPDGCCCWCQTVGVFQFIQYVIFQDKDDGIPKFLSRVPTHKADSTAIMFVAAVHCRIH